MPPTTRYVITRDGRTIAYTTIGEGPVDLLYVPQAIPAIEHIQDHPTVAAFFARLAAFSHVIFFDRRGSGMSEVSSSRRRSRSRWTTSSRCWTPRGPSARRSWPSRRAAPPWPCCRPPRPPSGCRPSSCTAATSRPSTCATAATSPAPSPAPASCSSTARTRSPSWGTPTPPSAKSRSSSPAPAAPPSPTACSRRSCSPTSAAPRSGRRSLATRAGTRCSSSTTPPSAPVARHRGRVVESVGDGVLATFDGPARAIRAARGIVEDVAALGLDARAGLHTGECEAIGDDVGGPAVHIAARVMAGAGPEQVLVSGTVRDLVVGSELRFEDRGQHELRGVPGSWRLWAVTG